jgi:hypothetical protein
VRSCGEHAKKRPKRFARARVHGTAAPVNVQCRLRQAPTLNSKY